MIVFLGTDADQSIPNPNLTLFSAVLYLLVVPVELFRYSNPVLEGQTDKKKQKHTTAGIHMWSSTIILTSRRVASTRPEVV